jgi:hypothetical protein
LIISSLVVLPDGCRGVLREDRLLVLIGDDWAEDVRREVACCE